MIFVSGNWKSTRAIRLPSTRCTTWHVGLGRPAVRTSSRNRRSRYESPPLSSNRPRRRSVPGNRRPLFGRTERTRLPARENRRGPAAANRPRLPDVARCRAQRKPQTVVQQTARLPGSHHAGDICSVDEVMFALGQFDELFVNVHTAMSDIGNSDSERADGVVLRPRRPWSE